MTGNPLAHPLIRDYLRDLEKEASLLPRQARRDLLAEIRGHLHEALATRAGTDADVRNLLNEMGEPRDIVGVARSDIGATIRGPGLCEVGALLLLPMGGVIPLGGVILPLIGWLIGVALLWWSNAWTSGQKLLGTFVIPGGLLAAVLLLSLVAGWTLPAWAGGPLLVVLVVASIAVTVHLWRSAQRRLA